MPPRPFALGLIFANRDFFPDVLVAEARRDYLALFEQRRQDVVLLSPEQSKRGGVETLAEARKCAALFREHRERIGGLIVVLPNFGDEKGVLEAVRAAGLGVPILVHGYPDDPDRLDVARRRDAFCGKISVCNNLHQAGIPFTLTERHVVRPDDPSFLADLDRFIAICRVVRGLRGARIGAIGARPNAFNTVRYSEKLLERHGISVTTADLSDVLGRAGQLADSDPAVQAKLEEIRGYAPTSAVPPAKLLAMARLGLVLDEFIAEHALDVTAIQCWTSLQRNHGCNVCTSMSMMSEAGAPSACEVDVTGALTMYALQLAGGSPSALVDWNNNYGGDPDRCVLFHCGNWAKSFLPDIRVATAPIIGTVVGEENTYGALDGRTPAGPLTYARISTDDAHGALRAYVGEGELTNDELRTFGTRAVARVPELQRLLRYVCTEGFEHHVAISASRCGAVFAEAAEGYLGWQVHRHPC